MTNERKGRLCRKAALISGGSRGIGAAIARSFALEGASVAITHHKDHENAARTLEALKTMNAACIALNCDVSAPSDVEKTVAAAQDALDGVDILVNCAAIGGLGSFEHVELVDWNRILAVNLTGPFLMAKHCYPAMKKAGSGRIINIASQWAFTGGIYSAAYVASKAGLIGLTRSLALECAPFGVLVNCVAPGATATDALLSCDDSFQKQIRSKIPLGRFGKPEEIASAVLFLASDEAGYFVGQTISPNGGDVFL